MSDPGSYREGSQFEKNIVAILGTIVGIVMMLAYIIMSLPILCIIYCIYRICREVF